MARKPNLVQRLYGVLIFIILFFGLPILPTFLVLNCPKSTNEVIVVVIIVGVISLSLTIILFVMLVSSLISKAFMGFNKFLIIRYFFVKEDSSISNILVSIYSYYLFISFFSFIYASIFRNDPNSFTCNRGMDTLSSFYFSIVTSATVGYGDIVPYSDYARFATILEIFSSFVFIGIILTTVFGKTDTKYDKVKKAIEEFNDLDEQNTEFNDKQIVENFEVTKEYIAGVRSILRREKKYNKKHMSTK